MTDTLLLIDFENAQKVDLAQVPANARVQVFYGITQKKIPEELVVQAQPFGSRLVAERPTTRCVILSADQGFDPYLVSNLLQRLFDEKHVVESAAGKTLKYQL